MLDRLVSEPPNAIPPVGGRAVSCGGAAADAVEGGGTASGGIVGCDAAGALPALKGAATAYIGRLPFVPTALLSNGGPLKAGPPNGGIAGGGPELETALETALEAALEAEVLAAKAEAKGGLSNEPGDISEVEVGESAPKPSPAVRIVGGGADVAGAGSACTSASACCAEVRASATLCSADVDVDADAGVDEEDDAAGIADGGVAVDDVVDTTGAAEEGAKNAETEVPAVPLAAFKTVPVAVAEPAEPRDEFVCVAETVPKPPSGTTGALLPNSADADTEAAAVCRAVVPGSLPVSAFFGGAEVATRSRVAGGAFPPKNAEALATAGAPDVEPLRPDCSITASTPVVAYSTDAR
jgi:hypothetical protein